MSEAVNEVTQPVGAPARVDALEQFARSLATLRMEAGDLSLRELEKRTSISKSMLGDVFRGIRVPSARNLEALIDALTPEEGRSLYRERFRELHARAVAQSFSDHARESSFPAGADRALANEPSVVPGMHNLPAPAGGWFVGRQQELAILHQQLQSSDGVIGQALHGLGGIGKTGLALRYAHMHSSEYSLTWWVNAETSERLTHGLADLARRFYKGATLTDDFAWSIGWLQSHTGWLLILDNVEDPAIIVDVLGAIQGKGRVLVTTRRDLGPVWAKFGLAPLRLDVLARPSSVQLLAELTGRTTETDEAEKLAAELGDLPLALEQAGAFIAQRGITIAEYRRRLAAQPASLLEAAADGFDASRMVSRVWELTMDAVTRRTPLAGEVLAVLAYLAPDQLPIDVLTSEDRYPGDTEEAIAVLATNSMISLADGNINVHRLVQAVTRWHDSSAEKHKISAAQLLLRSVPGEPRTNVDGWQRWNVLLPHIETLTSNSSNFEGSAELLELQNEAAVYLEGQGQIARAVTLFERVVSTRTRTLGAEHSATLQSRNDLANAYHAAGRLAEAIPLMEAVTDSRVRVLGVDHPDSLTSRNNLASMYESAGLLTKAVPLIEQVVADQLRVLGPDHPATLTARASLATTYRDAGRLSEAIALTEEVVADRLRVLGPEHPATLAARFNLATMYRESGRLAEGIALAQDVAADQLRIVGPDHPATLVARSSLATMYRDAGRLAEAIALAEEVVADQFRVMGPDHPATLIARANLGMTLRDAGRLGEAISLTEEVIADRQRLLGSDHPATLTSRASLGSMYARAGRLGEAIPLIEEVVADRQRILGSNHPATFTARASLGRMYADAGRFAEAIALMEEVVADRSRLLGSDHPATLSSLSSLAKIYRDAERISDALALIQQVLSDQERILGADHPETLITRSNLANIYRLVGREAEAVELLEQVWQDRRRILGRDHPVTAATQQRLAELYLNVGRNADAIECIEGIIADRTRMFGIDDPRTKSAQTKLASVRSSNKG